jgi:hypothetical protein
MTPITNYARTIVRIDRSPMNTKVWVVQLDCGHDICVYKKPRRTANGGPTFQCEKCETKVSPNYDPEGINADIREQLRKS